MTIRFIKQITICAVISAVISLSFVPDLVNRYRFFKVKKAIAVSAYPVQIGLTGVTLINCQVSCYGGCCVGGALCSSLTVADCPKTAQASGAPAGGTGNMALFSLEDLSIAGVRNGGQLMAGMTSITLPKANVCLAGEAGCVGTCCGL